MVKLTMAMVEGAYKNRSLVARALEFLRRDKVAMGGNPGKDDRRIYHVNGLGPFIDDSEGNVVDVQDGTGHSIHPRHFR